MEKRNRKHNAVSASENYAAWFDYLGRWNNMGDWLWDFIGPLVASDNISRCVVRNFNANTGQLSEIFNDEKSGGDVK